jgi:hypothetical protein
VRARSNASPRATTPDDDDGRHTRTHARVVVAGFRRPDLGTRTRSRIRRERRIHTREGIDWIDSILDRGVHSKSAPLRMVMDLRADGASSSSSSRRTMHKKTANKRKVMMRRGRKDGLRYVRDIHE